ncbi:hypothetical protein EXIGLDRAFT_777097 [Exidia glandulosa HHB12029]|uniref:Uncharacterized protein n=1 Tax=Exidia glandulosa HHB12029 TaxID=1314781 RepID=A0A165ZLV8_EXIGL|nr:hypothetical protein EXIGLDRAFT_777097 [Exidia glandulosa HHB12029]
MSYSYNSSRSTLSLPSTFTPSPTQSLSDYPGVAEGNDNHVSSPDVLDAELFAGEAYSCLTLLDDIDRCLATSGGPPPSSSPAISEGSDLPCLADYERSLSRTSSSSSSASFGSPDLLVSHEASGALEPGHLPGPVPDSPSLACVVYTPPQRRARTPAPPPVSPAESQDLDGPVRVFYGPDSDGAFTTSPPFPTTQVLPVSRPHVQCSNKELATTLALFMYRAAASPSEIEFILDSCDEEAKYFLLSMTLALRSRSAVAPFPIRVVRIINHAVRSNGIDYHCVLAEGGTSFVRDLDLRFVEGGPDRIAAYWRQPDHPLHPAQISKLLTYPQYSCAEGEWLRAMQVFSSYQRHRRLQY